jgi:polar amino acid transport system substrate-binding protein
MRVWNPKGLLSVLGVAVLLLAACGDDDDDVAEDDAVTDEAPDLGDTLTVCTDAPYEPFEFEDPDTGEMTGFDMELAREIASRLDMEMEVTVREFEGIWLAPAAGECDIVASAMTITEERAENALFSDSYFDADQSLLVLTENADELASLDDLEGGSIGVQSGTTGEEYAQENAPDDADIVSFTEEGPVFLALEAGDVDAVLQDLPVNGYRAVQDPAFTVVETFTTGEEYGIAAALDNEVLIDAINDALAEMRDDGTYDEIYAEWFGEVES